MSDSNISVTSARELRTIDLAKRALIFEQTKLLGEFLVKPKECEAGPRSRAQSIIDEAFWRVSLAIQYFVH